MTSRRRVLTAAAAAGLSLWLPGCRRATEAASVPAAAAPAGLRIDCRHLAQAGDERFELVGLTREAAPPSRRIERADWGDYVLVIEDTATRELLTRFGFDSPIDAAASASTTLTLRCALPPRGFVFSIAKRRPGDVFQTLLTSAADASIVGDAAQSSARVEALTRSGDARSKVDLAIVGDGYTATDRGKFVADAQRAAAYLFSVEPFRTRSGDFNVHALFVESAESGVSDDHLGRRVASAFGCVYGSGDNERTLSVRDERKLRDAASAVPYDLLLVIANSRRYGGSAYYGGPAVAAIDSAAARYLVLHEFAHAAAGLAEEYYIPSEGGPTYRGNVEPWQPNVTTSLQTTKWTTDRNSGSAREGAPNSWNQAQYERYFASYVKRYAALRAGGADERAVEKLMRDAAARQAVLLGRSREIGFFEGANGYSRGVYRSEADCIMFSLQSEYFCAACTAALGRAIDAHLSR